MAIFISSLIILLGLCFTYWGIYQIKTGKMVARRAKKPIDAPREVGVIFITLGLNLVFYIAPYFHSSLAIPLSNLWIFTNNVVVASAIPLAILNTAFFLFVSVYAFKDHKILGLKKEKNTKEIIEKYTKPVAILALVRALIFPLERLLLMLTSTSITTAKAIADTIFILDILRPILLVTLCVIYLVAYRQFKLKPAPKKVAKNRKK